MYEQATELNQELDFSVIDAHLPCFKVDGTSFLDAGSLVTTAHVTRDICPRDLKYVQKKQNKYGGTKIITYEVAFFLSLRDWIKTKVVLRASVVKQFSMH